MIKNNYFFSVLFAGLLVFLVYLKFALNDKYFSYFDIYNYQWNFERWLQDREMIPDRVIGFYFFQNSILQMVGLTLYSLTRWWNYPVLLFEILAIFLVFKKQINVSNSYKIISIFIICFNPVFYWRNTMNLRENIYAGLLFFLFYLSTCKWPNFKKIIIFLYIVILHGHPLVSFLALPIVSYIFSPYLLPSRGRPIFNIFKYWTLSLVIIVLSIFSLKWIMIQLSWYPMYTEWTWLSSSAGIAKNIDQYYFLLLSLSFIFAVKNWKKINRAGLYMLAYLYFFFELTFLPLWIAQYRFFPYILVFTLLLCGISFYKRIWLFPKIILMISLFIIWIPKLLSNTWYYAIKEQNMILLRNYLLEHREILNDTIYCGRASCSALRFVYPKKANILNIDNFQNDSELNTRPHRIPVIFFRDDENNYRNRKINNPIILK